MEGGEAVTDVGQVKIGVVLVEAMIEVEEAGGAGAEVALESGFIAVGEVVEVLGAALEGVAGTGEDAVGGEAGEALAGAEELVAVGAEEALVEAAEAVGDVVLGGGDELGGGGGGGGAEVGGGVGEDGVGGVADAGEDGEGGGEDGAAEGLVVEAVEVFPGAAAAGDEDDVGFIAVGGEPADAGGDFAGAVGALDGGGVDEEVYGRVAATADLDDVAEGCALEAGDDADAVGEGGEGALIGEDAFVAELFLEGLDGGEEGADADGLHGFGDELELAAGLVDGELAGEADGVAVFGAKAEGLGGAAEEDDGELGIAVLQGEVTVAAGGGTPVGDFTFDGDVAVGPLNEGADAAD